MRVETINEVLFLIICYHFVLYTDLVDISREMHEMIGWSQISFILLILSFNAYIMLSVTFQQLKRKFVLWRLKRNYNKKIAAIIIKQIKDEK